MSINRRVLITGANGFVGGHLRHHLQTCDYQVTSAVRSRHVDEIHADKVVEVGAVDGETYWGKALEGVTSVVHLANRAHVMGEGGMDSLSLFRQVNVEGSVNLAQQALSAGVKRFVFVSSVKVNGELTVGVPFSESRSPSPQDAYGLSKLEAEVELQELFVDTDCELVILRPPLIYGSGVKGNLAALLNMVRLGIPLPFGLLRNRRSVLLVDNFCSMIEAVLSKKVTGSAVYLVADRECLSTKEMVILMGRAMGKRVFLLPVPAGFLLVLGRVTGRGEQVQRLVGDLEVCCDKFYRDFVVEGVLAADKGFLRLVGV